MRRRLGARLDPPLKRAGQQRVDRALHAAQPQLALLLDERDSGTATAPVTWTSLDLAKPARVTGGVKLPASAFSPATVPSGASGVMKISLFDHGLNSSAIPGMIWRRGSWGFV